MEDKYCYAVFNPRATKLPASGISKFKNPAICWSRNFADGECKRMKSPTGNWAESVRLEKVWNNRSIEVVRVSLDKLYSLIVPLASKISKDSIYVIYDPRKKSMPVLYAYLPLFNTKKLADKNYEQLKDLNSCPKKYRAEKKKEFRNVVIGRIMRTDFYELIKSSSK